MTKAEIDQIRAQIGEARRIIADLEALLPQDSPPPPVAPVAVVAPAAPTASPMSVKLSAKGLGLSSVLLAGGQLDLSTREGRLAVVVPLVTGLLGKLGVFESLSNFGKAVLSAMPKQA